MTLSFFLKVNLQLYPCKSLSLFSYNYISVEASILHHSMVIVTLISFGFFDDVCFSLPLAECEGLQHEHPDAWPPHQFLTGHSCSGPKGCGAAGETHFRAWCGFLAYGHQGEPLAAYGDRCQQEEGRKKTRRPTNECTSHDGGCGQLGLHFWYLNPMITDVMTCNSKVDTCYEVWLANYPNAL